MSKIDLSNITAENIHTLCSESMVSHFFMCSQDEQERTENFSLVMDKAREFEVTNTVLDTYRKSAEEWGVTLPKSTKYIRLSGVQSAKTEWLWYPYIPLGKITLMTADPGTGKTFFSLYLTSAVSTGNTFFVQYSCQIIEPKTAIYQTAEDGIADTIKPRLEPMKPNFNNIVVIDETQEPLSLSNYEEIEQAMKDLKPALMIFDPLQAYLGAEVDMHRANEVRPVLSHIGHLAEKYKCAVIFIMHNSKMVQI